MRGVVHPLESKVKHILSRIENIEKEMTNPEMKQWFSNGESNKELTQLFETMERVSKEIYEHSFFLKVMSRNYNERQGLQNGIKIKR